MSSLGTKAEAKHELETELKHYSRGIEELRDDLNSYVDSNLPIYYSDITREWGDLPFEYVNRGVEEYGAPEGPTVYGLMLLDLSVYYYEIFSEALDEIEAELEEVNA
jgi:hypothetical protein